MKVESFETFVVGNPPPSFGGRYFIFVKLVADDGTVGYGEVYTAGLGADLNEEAARANPYTGTPST